MAVLTRGKFCEIRPVGRDDAGALLGVYRACEDFLGLGLQPKADMAMVLKDLDGARQCGGLFCGIHDATGRMIGVVDFTPRGFAGRPEVAFVSLLMVVPDLRGRGIGTEAVGLVEREIGRDPLVTMIRSAVQVNNPDTQRFWLRCGYRIIGEPEARPDGTTVLNLHKDFSHAA
jgi:RimJ/RimL family protein N-acetyltransferase